VLAVLVFAVGLGWFPATGLPAFFDAPGEHVRSLVLPALCLALGSLASYLRVLRTEMVLTLQEDYIVSARAKGLPDWWLLLRHALRPSSVSMLTVAGLVTGALIGGAVIIETVFVLLGLGSLAVEAIHRRDYPTVQGVVLVVGVSYVLLNFAVDALHAVIDPRIRDAHPAA
jgi:peptide/nickel transport system permease protein